MAQGEQLEQHEKKIVDLGGAFPLFIGIRIHWLSLTTIET